ncbi:MAG: hypothetical protein L6Q33_02285 [Bacteriovoracaceae bacterium]|nr:hypothetical protein [Bacteriovoracaceae bacterium]
MSVKIVQLNTENLFLLATTKENSSTDIPLSPKSSDKTTELAWAIKDMDPDILLLCEVGGRESLDLFNGAYLGDQYISTLIKGNSDRGIELGYLIHKRLNLKVQHFTHKKRVIGTTPDGESLYFSRDLGELRFFDKSDGDNKNPKLIILHSHLKSKWDRTGLDPLGKKQRTLEVEAIVQVFLNLQTNFPQTPIIVAGDLNGLAHRFNGEEEFQSIFSKTELQDVLEFLNLPENLRTTFVHFEKDTPPIGQQLDYVFFSPQLAAFINKENSGIYRFKNPDGSPRPTPQSTFERYALPSDHYPVVLTLNSL